MVQRHFLLKLYQILENDEYKNINAKDNIHESVDTIKYDNKLKDENKVNKLLSGTSPTCSPNINDSIKRENI